jgi:uncharacterized protein YodC (DUF2158 family)
LTDLTLGDRVSLVSGGPEMTVECIRPDGWAHTVWFFGDELCRDVFPAAGLKRIGRLRVVAGKEAAE